MVKEVLVEEPILYNVICAILKNPYVEYNKQVIQEEKGIMAVSEEERSAQFYKDPLWNSRTDYEYSGKIRT